MTEEAPGKRLPWRPSKYDPSYCERVMEYGRQGKSRTWIAAELGVVKQTLANWEAENPDFLVAMTYALMLSQQWWEDAGQTGMTADKFNNGVWSRSMGARFPDEWREKVAHVGGDKDKGDQPIQQDINISADAFTSRVIGQAARARDEGAAGLDPNTDQS